MDDFLCLGFSDRDFAIFFQFLIQAIKYNLGFTACFNKCNANDVSLHKFVSSYRVSPGEKTPAFFNYGLR